MHCRGLQKSKTAEGKVGREAEGRGAVFSDLFPRAV
jgi:hypothetical protein